MTDQQVQRELSLIQQVYLGEPTSASASVHVLCGVLCGVLSLASLMVGCGEDKPTANSGDAGESAGEQAGDSAGESAGESAGDSAGESAGDSSGESAGDSAGESAGESAGDPAGDEPEMMCDACASDDDCERGQSCVMMSPESEMGICFSPCFDDGTCGRDGESCVTLSHDAALYVCVPPSCDYCYDQDGDGYGIGSACADDDCDDMNSDIHSGMVDNICDGVDNNCNGLIDDDYEGQCPANSWQILNNEEIVDQWVLYEMILYRDAECTESLNDQVMTIASISGDEMLDALLTDGEVTGGPGGAYWTSIPRGGDAPSSLFISYTFGVPVDVSCVDLYQSEDADQRQGSIRVQSGFDGVWASNTLFAGEDITDESGASVTRFLPSVCGDGVLTSLEECDVDEPYCMGCVITYVGADEMCLMDGMSVALCEEGLVCIPSEEDDGAGACAPPRLLIEEEECDPEDETAICESGLSCQEGLGGYFFCSPAE